MSLGEKTQVVKSLAKGYSQNLAHKPSRFLVLRASLGVKAKMGTWLFKQGDVLDGVVIAHPVNAARKIVIRTDRGTFNVNEKDVKKL